MKLLFKCITIKLSCCYHIRFSFFNCVIYCIILLYYLFVIINYYLFFILYNYLFVCFYYLIMPSRRDRHIVLLAIFYFWSDFRNVYIVGLVITYWSKIAKVVCPSVRCNTFNKNSNNFVIIQRIFMVHSSNERATHFLK